MFSWYNTEEAFLLSSLNEIVKVWARGSGQAKFDLNICDGVADLSLNFKLGHPSDQHCDPPHHPSQQHVQPDSQQQGEELGQDEETFCPVPRRKSQARRERNRLRAARHRAAAAMEAGAAATENATEAAAASNNIILPFKGKILPVSMREVETAAPRTASSTSPPQTATSTSPTTASTAEAAVSAASSKLLRPVKACPTNPTKFEAELIKKRLFPIPSSHHQVPPRNPDAGKQKCYKMKEDDLWTKLFS